MYCPLQPLVLQGHAVLILKALILILTGTPFRFFHKPIEKMGLQITKWPYYEDAILTHFYKLYTCFNFSFSFDHMRGQMMVTGQLQIATRTM